MAGNKPEKVIGSPSQETSVHVSWKWAAIVSMTIILSLVGGWGAKMMQSDTAIEARLEGHEARLQTLERTAAMAIKQLTDQTDRLTRIDERQMEVLQRLGRIEERLKNHSDRR